MLSFGTKIRRMCMGRDVTYHLTEGTEWRIRAYMDRCNVEQYRMDQNACNDGEPVWNIGDGYEGDLLHAIDVLIGQALESNEARHGLFGTDWGEIVSDEQRAEVTRRFKEQREQGDPEFPDPKDWL